MSINLAFGIWLHLNHFGYEWSHYPYLIFPPFLRMFWRWIKKNQRVLHFLPLLLYLYGIWSSSFLSLINIFIRILFILIFFLFLSKLIFFFSKFLLISHDFHLLLLIYFMTYSFNLLILLLCWVRFPCFRLVSPFRHKLLILTVMACESLV